MIHRYRDKSPAVHDTAFVAESAHVIGDVAVGADSSIWFGAVVRGDVNFIRIGARTNVQDLTVIHVNHGESPTILEDDVTIGHRAILHGCQVKSGSLIGMGALLLDGVVVEERALVAAGSLLSPGTVVPAGKLALGAPARIVRDLSNEELERLERASAVYCELKDDYRR
ncbi:MAG TPA: gamma carbonic anhydrase family protein [Vicinamibacteria bacterium]|nr:gamma carbonic anhydrase family protein [Vicinamibacteria bacterium]